MYVYIESEPALWTVGFYEPATNRFVAESDWKNSADAARRVRYLNGVVYGPCAARGVKPMKCFSVKAEIEILVVAESRAEARRIATKGALQRVLGRLDDDELSVRVAKSFPYGWDAGSIVCGGDGTMTGAQAMALNKQE